MDMEICETWKTTLNLSTHVENHLKQIFDNRLVSNQGLCQSQKSTCTFKSGMYILLTHIAVTTDYNNCTAPHRHCSYRFLKALMVGKVHGEKLKGTCGHRLGAGVVDNIG